MAFKDTHRFWVIFDTCTRPSYYLDVHNLLASPEGAVLRYEYRETWLADSAVAAATHPDQAPLAILLVYAERRDFQRGDPDPDAGTPSTEMAWVGTRFGEMLAIPTQGDKFFFDFKVLGYPHHDQATLMEILRPKIQQLETPFRKWVTLSDQMPAFSRLRSGNFSKNWQAIVDALATSMQFKGDTFWRVSGASVGERPAFSLKPTLREEIVVANGRSEVRRVSSDYEVHEGDICSLEITSHTPAGQMGTQARRLLVSLDAGTPLLLVTGADYDLRAYTAQSPKLLAKRYEEIDKHYGVVVLGTMPESTPWPTGPKIQILFQVNKKGMEVLLGIICRVTAAALTVGALSTKIWERDPLSAIILAFIVPLLWLLSALLLKARLTFK